MESANEILANFFNKRSKTEPSFSVIRDPPIKNNPVMSKLQDIDTRSVVLSQQNIRYPCESQYSHKFGTTACLFICLVAIHNLYRHDFNELEISWQKVVEIGVSIKRRWDKENEDNNNNIKKDEPLLTEAIQAIKRNTSKSIVQVESAQGYLTALPQNPAVTEGVSYNFRAALDKVLPRDNTCAVFQIRDHAAVIFRSKGTYTIFDSHGSSKLLNPNHSFLKTTADAEDMETFCIAIFYFNRHGDSLRDNYFSMDSIKME